MPTSFRDSFQGPYIGTGTPTQDQDVSIEPKQTSGRSNIQQPSVSPSNMLRSLIPAAFMIIAVFWINASHIYGLFLNQGDHVKGAIVALADFDGGEFGDALRLAVAMNNQSYGFPTYANVDTSGSSIEQLKRDVFTGKYWAAIIVEAGASTRFDEALNGTVTSYNASQVYTCYLMSARYYTLFASGILSTTITTASTAAAVFSSQFIAPRIASGQFVNTTAAATALAVPARAIEATAASQDFGDLDDKVFLNTIGVVLPILMQFFFIMAWNGICNGMHLYAAYNLKAHILARLFWSTLWPMFTSLCSAGWTFAFRGSYHMDAKMFFACWAVTWVFSMINFDMVDIITGLVPMAFVPLIFLTWIIFNVAASLGAPDMLHVWYRINYFFPSLHWFQTLITIFSAGGVNHLQYTLPTLAGWLILLKCISPLATRVRVKRAQRAFRYLSERDALEAPH